MYNASIWDSDHVLLRPEGRKIRQRHDLAPRFHLVSSHLLQSLIIETFGCVNESSLVWFLGIYANSYGWKDKLLLNLRLNQFAPYEADDSTQQKHRISCARVEAEGSEWLNRLSHCIEKRDDMSAGADIINISRTRVHTAFIGRWIHSSRLNSIYVDVIAL